MKYSSYKWLLYAMMILFITEPAFAQKNKKGNQSEDNNTSDDAQKSVIEESIFIEGVQARMLNNDEDAISKFKQVLKIDPKNHAADYELSRLYYETGDYDQAEKYGNAALKLDPTNEWYYIYVAEAKSKKGDYQGASKVYEALTKAIPKAIEYYYDWAYMLSQQGKWKEALEVYDQLEKKMGGPDPDLIFQKENILIQLGELDQAAIEIQKLIDDDPHEFRYYGMLAELYEADKKNDKAIEAYQKLLEVDPDNSDGIMALAEVYKKEGNKEKYDELITKLFSSKSIDIDSKIMTFIPYIEALSKDSTQGPQALKMAEMLLLSHPDDPKAITAKADVLYNLNRKDEAVANYKKAVEAGECPQTIWNQLYVVLAEMEDYKGLLEYAGKGIAKNADEPLNYFYYSVAAIQQKEFEKAIDAIEKGLTKPISNPQLMAQMLINLGDSYNEIKNYPKADSAYEKGLDIDPNNATVLNNYAYYLSVRNEKLDKAEKMSKRSNLLEDNNSAFLDTYAWIMYQQSKYKEAKLWMEKALAQPDGSDRSVLLEHYGDILFKLGEVDKAVDQWKKALDNGGDKAVLEKKISTKNIP